jgi:hypothetical protein
MSFLGTCASKTMDIDLSQYLTNNIFNNRLLLSCNRVHFLACFIVRFIDLSVGDIQRLFILKSFFGCCMLSKICFNSSSVSDLFSFPVEAAFIK